MARAFNGTTQYLEAASSPIASGVPLTMSAWVKPTSTANGTALGLGNTANSTGYQSLGLTTTGAYMESGIITGVDANAPCGIPTTGVWSHIAGVVTAINSRVSYLNGVAGTPNTTSVTALAYNRLNVGALTYGSLSRLSFRNGDIGDCAIWNVALTAAEILALSRGVNPRRIRPQNLVFYAPIWGTGSPEPDYSSGLRHLTLGAAPTLATTNPRVAPMFGSDTLWMPLAVTAGGNATVTTPAATGTGASPAPTVTASAVVTTPADTATGAAPPPGVSGGVNATVTALPATGLGDAPIPAVLAGATVTLPAATATGASPGNLPLSTSVELPAAAATGTSPVPAVSGSGSGTVTAVPAAATGTSPAPTVQAGANVTAPATTGTGASPVPSLVAAAIIAAPASTGLGSAPTPAVQAGATIVTPTAAATGAAPAPTVTATGAGTVATPAALATGQSPAQTVTANALITFPTALGLGDAPAPSAGVNTDIAAPPADSTGQSPAPTLAANATVTMLPATAFATAPVPLTRQVRWPGADDTTRWTGADAPLRWEGVPA